MVRGSLQAGSGGIGSREVTGMLPHSTLRVAPLAGDYGHICRWMWLALPEDCQQIAALTLWQYPQLTSKALEAILRYQFRVLRHEVWDREISRKPRADPGLRPSRIARRTGYRTDSARHSAARMRLPAERRKEIARDGQRARRQTA